MEALQHALTGVALIGAAVAFGYAGAAGWLSATVAEGARRTGYRAVVAGVVAVAAAELVRWVVLPRTNPAATLDPVVTMYPALLAAVGYVAGCTAGLIRRARQIRAMYHSVGGHAGDGPDIGN